MAPAAIVMVIALLYPLLYMIWGSFRDWNPAQTIGETEFVGFKNYITLLYDPAFRESLVDVLVFRHGPVVVKVGLHSR